MTAGEEHHIIQTLQEFIQRELDLLRKLIDDARAESAEDHREVKQRLGNVEGNQATIISRVSSLETHEEAAKARETGALEERRELAQRRRAIAALVTLAATVAGAASGLAVAIIDRV